MVDFGLSEQQEMLRAMARDFLAKECPRSKVRELDKDEKGYDPKVWYNMAKLGWVGLVFPEKYGGTGGSFLDLVILTEEMGRNILPGPFFSTVALCALAILEFGTNDQKTKTLTQIAKGEAIWSLALSEESASYKPSEIDMPASLEGSNYILKGDKVFVPDAHIADYLIVVARTSKSKYPENGITLFIVDTKDAALKKELIPTMAGDRQFHVTFNRVKVLRGNILGVVNEGWEIIDFILQRAAVLKCAEIAGACQAVLEMTGTYAKERIQFDKPIGSFQAIQHKLVDMLIDVEGVQYLLYQAAWEISTGQLSRIHIAAAKTKANEAYQKICVDGIIVHGAIGFTLDHDIGLYYRRVRAAEFAAGNTDLHRETIALELGL